ncbi:MAG TPA: hypothetical protein VIF09_07240 [Polyangiaceae bacterium]|jgi:hypothetical protein
MNAAHSPAFALAVLLGLVAVGSAGGCKIGLEGERCNPSLSHDECGSGLSCQQPPDCPETYCCPTSGSSSAPNCQKGCAGGQASICAAGGDADCPTEAGDEGGDASAE